MPEIEKQVTENPDVVLRWSVDAMFRRTSLLHIERLGGDLRETGLRTRCGRDCSRWAYHVMTTRQFERAHPGGAGICSACREAGATE